MAYQEPGVLIHQILEPNVQATIRPQPAHISGGYAHLGRYADADEKPTIKLGFYDDAVEEAFSWPGLPDGATIDSSYTKLFIENALLRYFTGASGLTTVTGANDLVTSDTLSFKSNGDDYPRSAEFLTRDVQLGDIVRVRAVIGGDEYVLWSYVAGFEAETVAAVVGADESDPANAATQIAPSVVTTFVDGVENCVVINATDQASFTGIEKGNINETYRVRVVEGSIAGDATTARLLVTSASGKDDVGEITPSAFGVATAIGSQGLTVTWDLDTGACSDSAEDEDVSPDDFLVGQEWTISCGQAFTAPVATQAGTYTGTQDTVYIVEVTLGGLLSSGTRPQITVTTVNGSDYSGPTTVTASATPIAVGSHGVTIAFTGVTGLRAGDIYYIPVTAAKDGEIRTIKLGHNLPEDVIDNGETSVSLSLYMLRDIQVPEEREGFAPLVNWEQSDTEFTVKDSITVYDDEWVDDAGELQPLEVFSSETLEYGQMYLEYRAWKNDFCSNVFVLETLGDIDDVIPGPLTPDNPLKYGVYWAKVHSRGTPVYFTGICNPDDVDSWLDVLDYMENRRDIYVLVPLTYNAEVRAAWVGHALEQSDPTVGCRREVFLPQDIPDTAVVVDATLSTDDEDVLAVVEDDADTSGTQYTIVRVPGANGRFVTNGVRSGDEVRLLYSTDGFGNVTYTSRTVAAVVNQDTLRLSTSLGAPVSTPRKIEIHRTLTVEDQVDAVIAAKAFTNRRVCLVLPDEIDVGGTAVDGMFAVCALAGSASGVEPHRSLTRLPLQGFDGVPRLKKFKRSHLNRLAEAGFTIIVQNHEDGSIWARHMVTSGVTEDINQREESVTRNLDSISLLLQDTLDPFIGQANNVPGARERIYAECRATLQGVQDTPSDALLGPQIVSLDELVVAAHPSLDDHVVITTRMTLPYAINNIDDYLIV